MHKIRSRVNLSGWPGLAGVTKLWVLPGWPRRLLSVGLIGAWLAVLLGLPASLEVQPASWLTFIALLITPGYLLAELITWRLNLDALERLALAFPLGIAVLAGPGIVAMLAHLTLAQLSSGWIIASALVVLAWLIHGFWLRAPARLSGAADLPRHDPWAVDEILLLLLLIAAFIFILPSLFLPKIDGDAYAVNAFVADALAGLPLNATEPLFGTDLGPGVRMVFNQSLPMFYLWSYLSTIDPNDLTAAASRAMLALWAILASYTLGKAAGGRRLGLLTASIQLLIYMAAPFLRSDNASLFFFERTNADKFMVPVIMLPVVFALTLRFLAAGRREAWLAAAVATVAVSVIHPLIAAMQALALAAFAGLHLLLGLRSRVVWQRSLAVGGLVALVMLLPLVQLFMARGEAPLAPSYPSSFEGWPLGKKLVPILPFIYIRAIDLYGPLPDLTQLEASHANLPTSPFLIWRFAVNMNRDRLIMFDLDQYISDPNLILEPPYMLALLLLPLLLWRLRSNLAAQFALGTSLAILFVMFNPWLTPRVGALVMPWILWRFVWLLPYALIIALVAHRLLNWAHRRWASWLKSPHRGRSLQGLGALGLVLVMGLAFSPSIARNMRDLNTRSDAPLFYPVPKQIFDYLNQATAQSGPVTVLADQELSVTLPAYVAKASIIAHRVPTTSEVFPADQQDVALQRLIDQHNFFQSPYLTTESAEILRRYHIRYVIAPGGSEMDMQLRLARQWFTWVADDQSYSLYEVKQAPSVTASLQGNAALAQRQWSTAKEFFDFALEQTPDDLLAQSGLVDVAQAQGQLDLALHKLRTMVKAVKVPTLHYRLGQLLAERDQLELSIAEFEQARQEAPHIARFHLALGDACLRNGQEDCAAEEYQAAAAHQNLPDEAARLIAQADLWRQQERLDRALPLYEQAVALKASQYNQFVLEGAYRELGWYDRAETVLRRLSADYPLSGEIASALAEVLATQNKTDEALQLFRHTIRLLDWQAQDTDRPRLALAQRLLESNRVAEAHLEIQHVLKLQPHNAAAYKLQGDAYLQQHQFEAATDAYRLAFQIDPTQIAAFTSLSSQLRQHGYPPKIALELLQTAIHVNPNEPILFLALGDLRQRAGETQAALEAYQVALAKLNSYAHFSRPQQGSSGQSRAVLFARLAQGYENLGQFKPAMDYYRAAIAAAPKVAWTQVLLGDALRRRNDPVAAEASYRRAIQRDPTSVEAQMRLADLQLAQGNLAEGNALYAQALQAAESRLDQSDPGIVLFPGQTPPPTLAWESGETATITPDHHLQGPLSQASRPATTLLEADENSNALRLLARLYQVRGQADQAIQLYKLKIRQGHNEDWYPTTLAQYQKGLADLYFTQGQLDQALAGYRQAVALDEWWPEAHLGLARVLSERGDTANALRHLQIAVNLAPSSVEVRVALANLLDEIGDHDQALAMYQMTAEAYPGQAQATLAYGRALQERNRWKRAEEIYRATITSNPGSPDAYVSLAELLLNQARYDEAEALLRQGVKIDQQYLNAYLRLGELEERRGRPEQALAWFRQAAALPLTTQLPSATLIDALARYGDYDLALTYIEAALQYQPARSELLLRLGRVQRTLGRYGAAEENLLEAQRLDRANDQLYAELARLYLAQGRVQASISFYEQALNLQPAQTSYYLDLSQILATQGNFDQALAVLERGQAQLAQSADLYIARSNLQLQLGQPDLALATLEQGMLEVGEDASLLVAMGTYHMRRGDYDQVERRFTQALELRPDAAPVRTALADLYLRRDDLATALDYYQQAINLEPANPRHYLALANAYRLNDQDEEARLVYSKALSTTPTLEDGYLSLATLYQEQERWDEAQRVYERGLTAIPTSARLLTQYGTFWFERGDQVRALTLFDQALELAPSATTLIARAALYSALAQLEDAEQDLRTALAKEPGSIEARIALGNLYHEQGDLAQAEQWYQDAVSLLPGVPTGYLRLGNLANEQGDREKAREYAKTAHDLEPGLFVRPDTVQ